MTINYPIATVPEAVFRHARIRPRNVVGMTESPFTLAQQVFAWNGELWGLDVDIPPMKATGGAARNAEALIGWGLSLNGLEGTFLMEPPGNAGVRGTWAGSPKVLGAHASGVKSIAMDGFSAAATVKAGDWFQQGASATSRLHKITQDGTADGGGLLTIEIWPRTRAALADNDTFVTASPKGLWRLTAPMEWDIGLALIYGMLFSAVEALEI